MPVAMDIDLTGKPTGQESVPKRPWLRVLPSGKPARRTEHIHGGLKNQQIVETRKPYDWRALPSPSLTHQARIVGRPMEGSDDEPTVVTWRAKGFITLAEAQTRFPETLVDLPDNWDALWNSSDATDIDGEPIVPLKDGKPMRKASADAVAA